MAGSGDSLALEADLRAIVEDVWAAEHRRGTGRECTYGLGRDGYSLSLPSGYDDLAATVTAKFGPRVRVNVVDWNPVVETVPTRDARAAFDGWLDGHDYSRDDFADDEIRFDLGGRGPNGPVSRVRVRGPARARVQARHA